MVWHLLRRLNGVRYQGDVMPRQLRVEAGTPILGPFPVPIDNAADVTADRIVGLPEHPAGSGLRSCQGSPRTMARVCGGFPGFNTEEDRGPRRATEKQ